MGSWLGDGGSDSCRLEKTNKDLFSRDQFATIQTKRQGNCESGKYPMWDFFRITPVGLSVAVTADITDALLRERKDFTLKRASYFQIKENDSHVSFSPPVTVLKWNTFGSEYR